METTKKRSKTMDNQPSQPATMSTNKAPSTPPPKSKFGIIVVTLIAIILIAVVALMQHNPNKTNTAAKRPAAQVSITSDKFFPAVIDISAGQQITWTNQDSSGHWVASDPYPKDDALKTLNSGGPLQQNESYTYTFEKAGTYTYHDELHPQDLQGMVRVK
jgi:plastocyanin